MIVGTVEAGHDERIGDRLSFEIAVRPIQLAPYGLGPAAFEMGGRGVSGCDAGQRTRRRRMTRTRLRESVTSTEATVTLGSNAHHIRSGMDNVENRCVKPRQPSSDI
jgi:hypothetical protein